MQGLILGRVVPDGEVVGVGADVCLARSHPVAWSLLVGAVTVSRRNGIEIVINLPLESEPRLSGTVPYRHHPRQFPYNRRVSDCPSYCLPGIRCRFWAMSPMI